MIAQRFRALGWVAGVAASATALYLVSLQVAAERGKLDAVDRQIASAERDMRQLQTELGTRGSMRQLEKWNGEVLALSAPRAAQFLRTDAQLTALNVDMLVAEKPNAPPPVMTAQLPDRDLPKAQAIPMQVTPAAPALQRTAFERPAGQPHLQKVAMVEPALLGELARAAQEERRKRP